MRAIGGEFPRSLRIAAGPVVFAALASSLVAFLPAVDPAPSAYPADLVRDFWLASAGIQVVLWGSVAFLFGLAVSRAFGHGRPLLARERISS